MGRAWFVVIEGLDGVGKSTVAREVADRLGAEVLATPPATVAAARLVLERIYDEYPLARMLWYASTVAAASVDVSRLLHAGRSVVMVRYWLSTLVYAELRGSTCELDDVARHLVVPDLTVYLYARPDVRAARVHGRRKDNTEEDRRTLEPAMEQALDAGYKARISHPIAGRFIPLDVSDVTPEEAAAHIVTALRGGNVGW